MDRPERGPRHRAAHSFGGLRKRASQMPKLTCDLKWYDGRFDPDADLRDGREITAIFSFSLMERFAYFPLMHLRSCACNHASANETKSERLSTIQNLLQTINIHKISTVSFNESTESLIYPICHPHLGCPAISALSRAPMLHEHDNLLFP
jgi:hypothetical protein